MKISTTWLKDYVVYKPPLEAVAERLTMAGLEVKSIKDHVFELEITSNRPDWLSHIGVAREIAAVENLRLKLPEIDHQDSRKLSGWKVALKDPEGCPYYSGVLIEGVEMNPTPEFMRERLEACGQRSINLIVDITNYVLLETGQPLHAFDADLLKGKEIQVRKAKSGEKFTAIDGKTLELEGGDLVVADAQNPAALAGIMGGRDSEVSERTRNIFLESAYFSPHRVRASSRQHRLSSESSYRFERRVDPAYVDFARNRALLFIRKYGKPRFISTVVKTGTLPRMEGTKIHLTPADIVNVLGLEIKPHVVTAVLDRLGLEVRQTAQAWDVKVPSFRSDLLSPVDLVEEVARIHGFDKIPSTLPSRAPLVPEPTPVIDLAETSRTFLAGCGLYETVTFSLVSDRGLSEADLKEAPVLVNPMHKEMRWLRPTLLPSLLNVVRKNFDQGAAGGGFFEMAHTYRMKSSKKVSESKYLALALFGVYQDKNWRDAEKSASYYDLKGIVEAWMEKAGIDAFQFAPAQWSLLDPDTCEQIVSEEKVIGRLGRVAGVLCQEWGLEHDVYYAEISLEAAADASVSRVAFHPLPKFPAIRRDMAVVVDEKVLAGEVMALIKSLGGELLRQVEVFDIFRGGRVPPGHKNMAFRLTYQSEEKTLVSEDVQDHHASIAARVAEKFQATFQ